MTISLLAFLAKPISLSSWLKEEEITGAIEEFCFRSLLKGKRVREWCRDISNILDTIPQGEHVRYTLFNHPCHLLLPFVCPPTSCPPYDVPPPFLSNSSLSTISRRQLYETIDKLSSRYRHPEKRSTIKDSILELCLEYVGRRLRIGLITATGTNENRIGIGPEKGVGEGQKLDGLDVVDEIAKKLAEVEFDVQLHNRDDEDSSSLSFVRSVVIPIIQQLRFSLGFVTIKQLISKLNSKSTSSSPHHQLFRPSTLIRTWIVRRLMIGCEGSKVVDLLLSHKIRIHDDTHREVLIEVLESMGFSSSTDKPDMTSVSTNPIHTSKGSSSTPPPPPPLPPQRKHKKAFSLLTIKTRHQNSNHDHQKLGRPTISSPTNWFPKSSPSPSKSFQTQERSNSNSHPNSNSSSTDQSSQPSPPLSTPTLSGSPHSDRVAQSQRSPSKDHRNHPSTSSSETFPLREPRRNIFEYSSQIQSIPPYLMASILASSDAESLLTMLIDHVLSLRYSLTKYPGQDWFLGRGRESAQSLLDTLEYKSMGKKEMIRLKDYADELRSIFDLQIQEGELQEVRSLSRIATRGAGLECHRDERPLGGFGMEDHRECRSIGEQRIQSSSIRDSVFDLDQYIEEMSNRQSVFEISPRDIDIEHSQTRNAVHGLNDRDRQPQAAGWNNIRYLERAASMTHINCRVPLNQPRREDAILETPDSLNPFSANTAYRNSTFDRISFETSKRNSSESVSASLSDIYPHSDGRNDEFSRRLSKTTARSILRDSNLSTFSIRQATLTTVPFPSKPVPVFEIDIESLKRSTSADGIEELGENIGPLIQGRTRADNLRGLYVNSKYSRSTSDLALDGGRQGGGGGGGGGGYGTPLKPVLPLRRVTSSIPSEPVIREWSPTSPSTLATNHNILSPSHIDNDGQLLPTLPLHRLSPFPTIHLDSTSIITPKTRRIPIPLPLSPPLSPRNFPLPSTTPNTPTCSGSIPSTPVQYLTPTRPATGIVSGIDRGLIPPHKSQLYQTSSSPSSSSPESLKSGTGISKDDKHRRALFRRYAIVDGEPVSPSFGRMSTTSSSSSSTTYGQLRDVSAVSEGEQTIDRRDSRTKDRNRLVDQTEIKSKSYLVPESAQDQTPNQPNSHLSNATYETPLEIILSLLRPTPYCQTENIDGSQEVGLAIRHESDLTAENIEGALSRLISGEIERHESSGLDWEREGKGRVRWLIEQVEEMFKVRPELCTPFPKLYQRLSPQRVVSGSSQISSIISHSVNQVDIPQIDSFECEQRTSWQKLRPPSLTSQETFGRRDSKSGDALDVVQDRSNRLSGSRTMTSSRRRGGVWISDN